MASSPSARHSDGPGHTHDLKTSNILKKPTKVTQFVEAEASKGYRAPAIKGAALEHFKDSQLGIEFLQYSTILNAQHKMHGGLDIPFIGADDLGEDLKESLEWKTTGPKTSKSPSI